ncbi:carbamoyltransferase HypF [Butyrivibrio sp. CB08]|uniref:carbamoyltransferase HypF n=1 Tax=Butyrivibrio sp. CB08 TaxID=2364879 RepID=UPI000EAA2D77|nr:carbamoyltransferase HypF [Butyrivibrio sp. CB08]RKM62466.1 carbamoyltransferase HypF [Butyrivibrio sp. CB08]
MIKEITVKGAVQGVGYRPFIACMAKEFNIAGFVKNMGALVQILAIGKESDLKAFISCINSKKPEGAFILSVNEKELQSIPSEYQKYSLDFSIIDSSEIDLSSDIPVFLPDIGICDDCKRELFDKDDRRYRYPLISCAICGPRMSILNSLPYDRQTTTMDSFSMCPSCQAEYAQGRRRYAQTISCHDCGPQMILDHWSVYGEAVRKNRDEAVVEAIDILKNGGILGLKGVSGYQLVCKPEREPARRLRAIKGRESKPFAIMFSDIESVREYACVSDLEEELLVSSGRPIVLLQKKNDLDDEVVRGSRYIGAFLPSAGIHSLLTKELGPLIVTSANKSDEPIIIDDKDFVLGFFKDHSDRESNVDGVLFHERNINMPMDDSVMFVISNKYGEYPQFIRRSRGYVPLPVIIDKAETRHGNVVFAFGGDLKSTFAFGHNDKILPSQYIGDLEDYSCAVNYKALTGQYKDIFKQVPSLYVCDKHPSYVSSQMAKDKAKADGIELIFLQHHFAHTYSVMAENGLESAIGVSFDGTGYGIDGAVWGGEFTYCNKAEAARAGHLSYVTMTGGDNASKDARLISKCYLHKAAVQGLISKDNLQSFSEDKLLFAALDNKVQTFECSSMGRLFDAISAFLGICDYNSYEGECAIRLENAAWEFVETKPIGQYPEFDFDINITKEGFTADQIKLFSEIYNCVNGGNYSAKEIAYGFHMAVVRLITKGCAMAKEKYLENKVCLSGGVFNNRLILSKATEALMDMGFEVFWNKDVPLGDGGISVGQAYYGLMFEKE